MSWLSSKNQFVASSFDRCINRGHFCRTCGGYDASCTFVRRLFKSLRLRFDSRILRLSARGRGDLRLRSFSRSVVNATRASFSRRSIVPSSLSRASLRFCAWERESCTVTLIPVGRCRRVTAVETLFTFWPPGPLERVKLSSRSASRIIKRAIFRLVVVCTFTPLPMAGLEPARAV